LSGDAAEIVSSFAIRICGNSAENAVVIEKQKSNNLK
jgi:hypothetical protein